MDGPEIARRRMHNQRLWGDPLDTPVDAVRWMAALQSQEYAVAKWSVAQRCNAVSDADMDRAFADGAILRTHVLRPTWHFVLPADIRWMLQLSAPRVNALNAYYYRRFELDDGLFAKTNALIADAVRGGEHRTRKELGSVLDHAGIVASRLRLAYILMRAELDAVVCSGAPRGRQHTYAAFDERTSQATIIDRDEALAELARRYFTSRGPATVRDFVRWSSLTAADGKRGLEMVRSAFDQQVVDGRAYWFAESGAPVRAASPIIDLVQGYDECIMSYSESRDVLFPRELVGNPQPEAVFTHAVLFDGRLVGHWRHPPKTNSTVIETSLYRPLDDIEAQALRAAAERYGRFLGLPVALT